MRRCSAPPFLYFGGRIIREKILIKTERLVLRELGDGDFDVLYAVRDFIFAKIPFCKVFSYMKKSNIALSAVALGIGMKFERDFTDAEVDTAPEYRQM